MNINQDTLLIPEYIKKFKCIGPDCEDTCCSSWRIPIDKGTYKKYKNVNEQELATLLNKSVKRNKNNGTDQEYAFVLLDEAKRCPLLTEASLCSVQEKLGESYLSKVCTTYPRVLSEINGSLEKSASLSCPEVARLALTNSKLMSFEYIESEANNYFISGKLNKSQTSLYTSLYLWEIRAFCIEILQYRNTSLEMRIIFLGVFINEFQSLINMGDIKEIPNLIEYYRESLYGNDISELLEENPNPNQYKLHLVLISVINNMHLKGVNTLRYSQCLEDFSQGLGSFTGNMEELISKYVTGYKSYYSPFFNNHEYILENYLVNYVFQNLFPLGLKKSFFENYALLVLHFSIIKVILVGIGLNDKELTIDKSIKLIQSFEKEISYNKIYMTSIFEVFKNSDYINMFNLTSLIKK